MCTCCSEAKQSGSGTLLAVMFVTLFLSTSTCISSSGPVQPAGLHVAATWPCLVAPPLGASRARGWIRWPRSRVAHPSTSCWCDVRIHGRPAVCPALAPHPRTCAVANRELSPPPTTTTRGVLTSSEASHCCGQPGESSDNCSVMRGACGVHVGAGGAGAEASRLSEHARLVAGRRARQWLSGRGPTHDADPHLLLAGPNLYMGRDQHMHCRPGSGTWACRREGGLLAEPPHVCQASWLWTSRTAAFSGDLHLQRQTRSLRQCVWASRNSKQGGSSTTAPAATRGTLAKWRVSAQPRVAPSHNSSKS